MRGKAGFPAAAVAGLLLTIVLDAGATGERFKVVAHPGIPGQKIKRSDLSAVYLKTVTRWSDGRTAVPVDQPANAEVRKRFSEEVLGLSVVLASQYWLKQMTSGARRAPPPVKGSDAEVVAYVRQHEGAVGYVSADFAVPEDVKVIEIGE